VTEPRDGVGRHNCFRRHLSGVGRGLEKPAAGG
jgi:hypothetical protein